MQVERCLFVEESASASMPQHGNVIPSSDPESTDSKEIIPIGRSSGKRKDHAAETDGQMPD
ncbi:unnamed protein product [Prunus armeniaca]|uniref:Uncharacterized protein n=1 Tax=Prunus armeniaca TaxID=36596 RepID=A0A6J5THV6_PRUAR|nr:unnamed protein product [Prunus armeniaca]